MILERVSKSKFFFERHKVTANLAKLKLLILQRRHQCQIGSDQNVRDFIELADSQVSGCLVIFKLTKT